MVIRIVRENGETECVFWDRSEDVKEAIIEDLRNEKAILREDYVNASQKWPKGTWIESRLRFTRAQEEDFTVRAADFAYVDEIAAARDEFLAAKEALDAAWEDRYFAMDWMERAGCYPEGNEWSDPAPLLELAEYCREKADEIESAMKTLNETITSVSIRLDDEVFAREWLENWTHKDPARYWQDGEDICKLADALWTVCLQVEQEQEQEQDA